MWGIVYVADYKSLYSQLLDYKSSRTACRADKRFRLVEQRRLDYKSSRTGWWKKNFNKKKEIFSISFFCSHHFVIITLYPFESIRTIYCPTESGKENESSSTLREKINFPSIVKIETWDFFTCSKWISPFFIEKIGVEKIYVKDTLDSVPVITSVA